MEEIVKAFCRFLIEHGSFDDLKTYTGDFAGNDSYYRAFNGALIETLQSAAFSAASPLEQLIFLNSHRPMSNRRFRRAMQITPNFAAAREAWIEAVFQAVSAVKNMGGPKAVDTLSPEIRRVYYRRLALMYEPTAVLMKSSQDRKFTVLLERPGPFDAWYASLQLSGNEVCRSSIFLATGHLSSRSLEIQVISHRAAEGGLIRLRQRERILRA